MSEIEKSHFETQFEVLGVKFLNSGIDMKNEANSSMIECVKNIPEMNVCLNFNLLESGNLQLTFDLSKNNENFQANLRNYNREHFPNDHLEKHLHLLLNETQTIHLDQAFFYRGELNSPIERCLVLATSTLSYPEQNVPQIQFIILYANCPAQITDLIDICRCQTMARSHDTENRAIHTNSIEVNVNEFKISMSADVEMQEDFSENKWNSCHIDKDSFKLRTNLEKRILITIKQDPQQLIKIERCFGMLLSPGRYVGSSDMVAIGLNSINVFDIPGTKLKQWTIVGSWIPSELNFELLNTETSGDSRVYFSIAIDLIIERIDEPVRFIFETKAKIVQPSQWTNVSATEKIWQLANLATPRQKHITEHFMLILLPEGDIHTKRFKYKVLSCLSNTQFNTQRKQLSLKLNSIKSTDNEYKSMDSVETPTTEDMDDSDDEPLASGTGQVSKECAHDVLLKWKTIMDDWRKNFDVRPKNLIKMVRRGVPEALRPEVWQILSGSNQVEKQLLRQYTTLLSKESNFEAIIRRDISRTFPAHDMFKEPGGSGQESLFKICKAYSSYDTEIGYCQGLSFLIAALLLHMPEEQAFCVLVRIMYDYRLRELYKSGLEELHCKFYQLERLLEEHVPELSAHFCDLHIETHMYASQWFLTLYTTRFPLNAVFLIIDLFLLDDMDTLLKIAISMLKFSKNDLLTLDFEGIMKYFRINLPKIYRIEENAHKLIRNAVKINTKKAKRYEAEYKKWQIKEKMRLNPIEYLEGENKRLINMNIHLEQENHDLSAEIISLCKLKGDLQNKIANLSDKNDILGNELNRVHNDALIKKNEIEEEKQCILIELKNLQKLHRSEVEKAEKELSSKDRIIEEYKNICKSREEILENEKTDYRAIVEKLQSKISNCESCSFALNNALETQISDFIDPKSLGALQQELIETKLALAEANACNDQINCELRKANSELNLLKNQNELQQQQRSNTWFGKTFITTIRDATKTVKPSNSLHGLQSQTIPKPETSSLNDMPLMNVQNSNDSNYKRSLPHNRDTVSQT